MELLRIVAMFLVLVVHADFFSLGSPTQEEVLASPLESSLRIFFQSLSIVCVDVFVLISGWFGIRPKIKSFAGFIFQCFFFLIGIYVVCLLMGISDFSLRGVAGCLLLLKWNWFIKAYIGLYILAPVINAFVERSTPKQMEYFLLAFFGFQTVYGGLDAAPMFQSGYSTMSFIGLYVLARYVRICKPKWSMYAGKWYLAAYLLIVVLMSVVYFVGVAVNMPLRNLMYSYINPLVIFSSLSLLLYFSKLEFSCGGINKVAASSFAVFLLHTNPNLCMQQFVPCVQHIYELGGCMVLGRIFVFLLLVFAAAVCIDQIRIVAWRGVTRACSALFCARRR